MVNIKGESPNTFWHSAKSTHVLPTACWISFSFFLFSFICPTGPILPSKSAPHHYHQKQTNKQKQTDEYPENQIPGSFEVARVVVKLSEYRWHGTKSHGQPRDAAVEFKPL